MPPSASRRPAPGGPAPAKGPRPGRMPLPCEGMERERALEDIARTAPEPRPLGDGGSWLALEGGTDDVSAALEAAGVPPEVRPLLEKPSPAVRRKELPSGLFLGLARYAIGPSSEADRTLGSALWLGREGVVSVDFGATPCTARELQRHGPGSRPGGPFAVVAAHLAEISEDLEDDLHELSPLLDELEDRIAEHHGEMPVGELSALRQRLIRVRRHAVPFGLLARGLAADRRLAAEPELSAALHDIAESVERSLAALGLHFDRSEVLNDQIQAQLAERMNRATYRLGVVATVFLPLGFLTGLLGINVAGIPGDHDPYAFWLVCGFLLLVAVFWTAAITRSGRI